MKEKGSWIYSSFQNIEADGKKTAGIIFLAVLFSLPLAWSKVTLPSLFSNHMVLQRHVPIPVWGTANPGHVLSVQLGDEKGVATADQDGKWKVVLPATEAGGPFELAIKTEGEIITITDVLMVKDWRTAMFIPGKSR